MQFLKKIISVVCLNMFVIGVYAVCADGFAYAHSGSAKEAETAQYGSGVSEEPDTGEQGRAVPEVSDAGGLRMTVRDECGTRRLLCPDCPTYLRERIFFSFPESVNGWEVCINEGAWEETGDGEYMIDTREISEGQVLTLRFRALDADGRPVSSRSYALAGDGS